MRKMRMEAAEKLVARDWRKIRQDLKLTSHQLDANVMLKVLDGMPANAQYTDYDLANFFTVQHVKRHLRETMKATPRELKVVHAFLGRMLYIVPEREMRAQIEAAKALGESERGKRLHQALIAELKRMSEETRPIELEPFRRTTGVAAAVRHDLAKFRDLMERTIESVRTRKYKLFYE